MKHFLLWAGLLPALISCAALPHVGDVLTGTASQGVAKGPLYTYRADILLTLEGKTFDGLAATKLTGPLDIKIESKVKLDRLQITSCARQDVFEAVDKTWYGGVGHAMIYHYVPIRAEFAGACPLYIEAFDKSGLAAWGLVGFRSDETMQAHIDCNGKGVTYAGYSVCQTKNGLEQALVFQDPVDDFEIEPICNGVTADNKTFTFHPGLGVCRASFYRKGEWHTLNMIGYDQVLVRE